MPGHRRVLYARINRRTPNQALFDERPFGDDIRRLNEAGQFHATFGENEWFATDLEIEPSETFMSGVLGFVSVEQFYQIDPESPSWKKAPASVVEGGTRRTMTAFALDLREERRWLAFAPTQRITPISFPLGFKVLLEAAVATHRLMPAEWDVNLIPSTTRIHEWLLENPDVREFIRIVRRPNPGRSIDQDIEKMVAMGAGAKREAYKPHRGRDISLLDDPDLLDDLIEGSAEGDVEITIKTRTGRSTYRSHREIEEGTVEDWGYDWDLATDRMLEVVRLWSEGRAQEAQQRLDAEGEGQE